MRTRNWKRNVLAALAVLAALVLAGLPVLADDPSADEDKKPASDADKKKDKKAEPKQSDIVEKLVVTATRQQENVFEVPQPVSVVTAQEIEEKQPNSATDLLRDLPGVDVNGVGTNQTRPYIRGQRGQRILLLEDGLSLNNARRQSDFGEMPGLVDVNSLQQVEVVRGPASVLYGSDAIGGVINMITMEPPADKEYAGMFSYRYGTADSQGAEELRVGGRLGQFGYFVTGAYRSTEAYDAPAGSFGNITLADDATVNDTGVRDHSISTRFSFYPSEGHEIFARYQQYRAGETGFGYVDPALYDPGSAFVRLTYPHQDFDEIVLGYRGHTLGRIWADSFDARFYARNNERAFEQNIFAPFGIPDLPEAGVRVFSTNFTDYETDGLRAEARKLLGKRHVLTYGLDWSLDHSGNVDHLETTVEGFGPPEPEIDDTPRVPNATYETTGLFIQDEIQIVERFKAIVGARYQDVTAKTKPTQGLEEEPLYTSSESATVWAANLVYSVNDELNLNGTVGTAFRSPNLIERFFDGPTPEGVAWESRNLDLKPEKSLNWDLGFKYRRENFYLEATYFDNTIKDGIRIAPTGGTVNDLPEYQNVNIDELEYNGAEGALDWSFWEGFSIGLDYSHLRGKDVNDPANPISEVYSDRYGGSLRYVRPGGRFWAEYRFRHNGEQKDVELVENPIGSVLPAFTVHLVRGGVRLFRLRGTTHKLTVQVSNLTNTLYAEFSNASFFRPEPKRSLLASYSIDF